MTLNQILAKTTSLVPGYSQRKELRDALTSMTIISEKDVKEIEQVRGLEEQAGKIVEKAGKVFAARAVFTADKDSSDLSLSNIITLLVSSTHTFLTDEKRKDLSRFLKSAVKTQSENLQKSVASAFTPKNHYLDKEKTNEGTIRELRQKESNIKLDALIKDYEGKIKKVEISLFSFREDAATLRVMHEKGKLVVRNPKIFGRDDAYLKKLSEAVKNGQRSITLLEEDLEQLKETRNLLISARKQLPGSESAESAQEEARIEPKGSLFTQDESDKIKANLNLSYFSRKPTTFENFEVILQIAERHAKEPYFENPSSTISPDSLRKEIKTKADRIVRFLRGRFECQIKDFQEELISGTFLTKVQSSIEEGRRNRAALQARKGAAAIHETELANATETLGNVSIASQNGSFDSRSSTLSSLTASEEPSNNSFFSKVIEDYSFIEAKALQVDDASIYSISPLTESGDTGSNPVKIGELEAHSTPPMEPLTAFAYLPPAPKSPTIPASEDTSLRNQESHPPTQETVEAFKKRAIAHHEELINIFTESCNELTNIYKTNTKELI